MADLTEMIPGEMEADSRVADLIREPGLGRAAAPTAPDDNSVRQMAALTARRGDLGGRTLLDLGLVPAFCHERHADISRAMQRRLEVGETSEPGFGIRAEFGDLDRDASTSRET